MHNKPAGALKSTFYWFGRLREYVGAEIPAEFQTLTARVARIRAAGSLRVAIETAEKAAAGFAPDSGRPYALPTAAHVNNALIQCANENPRMVPAGGYWQTRAAAVVDKIKAQRAEYAAAVLARNAEAIEQWRNGARVYLPSEAPTMARIRGDIVETSRGASVPLSHAARLVKIAERIAARGGSQWADGSGPMVGHYRVQSIGADFSAVIGCHKFDAAESARIIAAIKQTADYIGAVAA